MRKKLLKIRALHPLKMQNVVLEYRSIKEARFHNPALRDFEVVG